MSTAAGMLIGAYDPSISKGGICVLAKPHQKYELVHHRKVQTSSKLPVIERLDIIRRNVVEVCLAYRPTYWVVENQDRVVVGAGARGKRNHNTSRQLMAYAAGVVAAQSVGVHVWGCEPQAAKKALLGPRKGNADKEEVQAFLKAMFGIELSKDEADAGAACVFGWQEATRKTKGA